MKDNHLSHDHTTLVIGSHAGIIQSILDFDYLSGKSDPSVHAILAGRDGFLKLFWGREEVLIPTHVSLESVPQKEEVSSVLNLSSSRRVLENTLLTHELLPNLSLTVIFAEGTPETHALKLSEISRKHDSLIIGPASVGLLVPGITKIGPIGGITPAQLTSASLTEKTPSKGLAVISASGGMTNELINIVAQKDLPLSFALALGGDRFPATSVLDAFLLAENDPQTKGIIYYGELGGYDEYEIVGAIKEGKIQKPITAHIAGTVSSLFPSSPQFGHAKAKAASIKELASVKRDALKEAGVKTSSSFSEFIKLVQ